MQPLTSTLADLTAAKLEAFAAAAKPAQPPVLVQGSADPAVFRQASYIKALNLQAIEARIYGGKDVYGVMGGENQQALDRFSNQCHEWEEHGKSGIPAWPLFFVVDLAGFDQWWAMLSAKWGEDAPPLFFIKPASPLPPVTILDASAPPPAAPATDGPIGSAVPNNPGVFNASSNDKYPDGYVYAGPTGIYQKHVYSNPFTAGQTRILWIALRLSAA